MKSKTAALQVSPTPKLVVAAVMVYFLSVAEAYAYVDPGTTGMLSQLLYLLFYAVLGGFVYLLHRVKKAGGSLKSFLLNLFRMKNPE